MKLEAHRSVNSRRQGGLLICSLAFLVLTGCGTSGAGQSDGAPTTEVQAYTAEAAPVATLPAPADNAGNPDTQPATIGRADPDTQPATVPGVQFKQVTCGTATMDLPANLQQVSQYGDRDITTEYQSPDAKTRVELVCRDRTASDNPNTDFQNTKNALTKTPEYTYNKNNRWVITGPGLLCAGDCPGSDASEFYKATWYSDDKVFSMLWEYPTFDDEAISPVIDHVYHSFKWNSAVTPGQTQQPVAPIAPAPHTATTTTRLSLREAPDCNSARLAWIPNGTAVNVERAATGPETGWYLVSYQGQTGWASGYFLDGEPITYDGPKLCEN